MSEETPPLEGEETGDIVAPEPNLEETQSDGVEDPSVDDVPSLEDVAAQMGWSPQDQWKGDPEKWKPAHEFVRDTAEINTKLNTRLKGFEQRLDSVNRTNEAMMERALATQRNELLAKKKEAFDLGDFEGMQAAEKRLDELPETVQSQPQTPPEAQAFIERHASWWGKDQEATAWASNRAGELAKMGLGPARQTAIVERELGQFFPEYATQKKSKPKPTQLTQPGRRSATKKELTLSDLPKEAQDAARYFEKKGVPVAEYLKSYKEQEGLQ